MPIPMKLPSGAIPEKDQLVLEALQEVLFGKTAVDAVHERTCIACDATGITERDFELPENIRWYMIFGHCQACQNAMAANARLLRRARTINDLLEGDYH